MQSRSRRANGNLSNRTVIGGSDLGARDEFPGMGSLNLLDLCFFNNQASVKSVSLHPPRGLDGNRPGREQVLDFPSPEPVPFPAEFATDLGVAIGRRRPGLVL